MKRGRYLFSNWLWALIVLASVGVAVFVTAEYSMWSAAIALLIAAALLTIVFLQDIVPLKDPRARYWLEAIAATFCQQ